MAKEHRLAAIMFTDIAGYTALMGHNEDKAFEMLSNNREIHNTLIKRFNGTFIKEMGDGTLASFSSASDAILCAMEIQREARAGNIPLKIGIHEGEMVFEEADVRGDGVNIASRLQENCKVGCITISETVYKDVKNKPGIKTEYLEEKKFKNVEGPVKIYGVLWETEEKRKEIKEMGEQKINPGKRKLLLAGTVLVLVIIFWLGWHFFPVIIKDLPPVPNSETASDGEKSIAVLPFLDMSPQRDQEYFCDGMTEEIINRLSNIKELKVPARTSVFMFKGKTPDPQEIGDKLKVQTYLEGSVRKEGNNVRITVQLINIADGYHILSETYDRELNGVFAIQDEIASAIVTVLKANLLPGEKVRIEKKQTVNIEAYQLYLKGLYLWNKRRADYFNQAIDYFNQAIEKDSTYALAYAYLASTYLLFPEYVRSPAKEFYPKAAIAAEKALKIDSTLAEAYAVLGLKKTEYEWDWLGAEREFKRAIELNPNDPTSHHWYTIFLFQSGRFDEALLQIKIAIELDPLSIVRTVTLGEVLFRMQKYDQAIDQYKKTLDLDPNFPSAFLRLGRVYEMQGKYDEAILLLNKVRTLVGDIPYGLSDLGHVYALAGRKKDAMKVLDELLQLSNQEYSLSYDIAYVYYGLGDKESTFIWLEKAYQDRHFELPRINTDPTWITLRSDSRFIALMKKMGLEQ